MNSSHDLGGVTGAEKLAVGYVPGEPLRVFVAAAAATDDAEVIEFARRYVGELEIGVHPLTCGFCITIPLKTGEYLDYTLAEVKTFFDRFGTEARVYEWDRFEQKLFLRPQSFYENPRRRMGPKSK